MQPTPARDTSDQTPHRRRRSLFLPGFALGFLLLATLSCGGALYAAGIDTSRLAELRDGAAWTPPPTPVQLVPQQTDIVTDQTLDDAGVFRPGEQPRNVTASLVNVRTSPGYLGKPPADVIAQLTPGQQVEILEGPQSADGLTWWRVRPLPPTDPAEGWIAEATASGVQILGE
jgi:hypothetical protein